MGLEKEHVDHVYNYVAEHGKLGAHPHQIAKALNLGEQNVIGALRELEGQGKIRLRTSNIEWKFRRAKSPASQRS